MSAEVLEKAGELAEAISESKELAVLRDTEMVMKEDPGAMAIIEEFQVKQQDVYGKQMRGEELSEESKHEVALIEQKMNENPVIKAYLDASEKFEHLMRSVNLVITSALTGNDEEGCGGGCSSGCCGDCGSECH